MSRTAGIVVARTGSTRVPGKALLDLAGKPALWHVMQAALAIRGLDEVCLATSDLKQDDALEAIARGCGVRCFRGDPERVLDRVHGAAAMVRADVIVDIGGDCPLLDPAVIERALAEFRAQPCDYLSNYEPPTFPEGLDVNIITHAALDIAFRKAVAPSQRIHPFSYLTRHPEEFRLRNFAMSPDLSTYHWSLDFPEDIEFVRLVFSKLYRGKPISMDDVLRLIERNPEAAELNRALIKPVVKHAFWNSPGIIRDMHSDIKALIDLAEAAARSADHVAAERCYGEAARILVELQRQAQHRAGGGNPGA